MVVLTIVAPSNEHTVYFKEPLPKPNYVRLLCCSLYNSWNNLKSSGRITLFNSDNNPHTCNEAFQDCERLQMTSSSRVRVTL